MATKNSKINLSQIISEQVPHLKAEVCNLMSHEYSYVAAGSLRQESSRDSGLMSRHFWPVYGSQMSLREFTATNYVRPERGQPCQ